MPGPKRWFDSLPLAHQLVVLTAVLDPLGAAGGYVLGPSAGLDPLVGAAVGVALASLPVWALVATRTT